MMRSLPRTLMSNRSVDLVYTRRTGWRDVFHFRTCLGRFCFNDAGTLVLTSRIKRAREREVRPGPAYAWAGAEAKKSPYSRHAIRVTQYGAEFRDLTI
jgi:hypothetical protein